MLDDKQLFINYCTNSTPYKSLFFDIMKKNEKSKLLSKKLKAQFVYYYSYDDMLYFERYELILRKIWTLLKIRFLPLEYFFTWGNFSCMKTKNRWKKGTLLKSVVKIQKISFFHPFALTTLFRRVPFFHLFFSSIYYICASWYSFCQMLYICSNFSNF